MKPSSEEGPRLLLRAAMTASSATPAGSARVDDVGDDVGAAVRDDVGDDVGQALLPSVMT